MILTIARKELLEMVRDGRFRWAAGITLLLLLGAVAIGAVHARDVRREVAAATEKDRRLWDTQGVKNPHSAAHYGVYAFKPSQPLSFADRGLDAYLGQAVWLEAHWQNLSQNRPAEDRTAVQRFGELTAATVLQLLVPLLVILLAFSALAGEREMGTLRQLASLGLPGRTLATGKALGVAAALGALLLPAAAIGSIALVLVRMDGAAGFSLGRAALMASGYSLYLAAFVGLSLAVSAVASSSRVALVSLLGFWIANGLALPRAAADLSERLYPSPSATELYAEMRRDLEQGLDGHNPADKRRKDLEAKVLAQYGVKDLKDLPVSFAGLSLQAGEEHANDVFDRHFPALWATFEHQERVHLGAAILSPMLAARSVSMAAAGTDFAHHRRFATAAEGYRRDLQRYLNGALAEKGKGEDYGYMADDKLWSKVRDFEYEPPAASWVLSTQMPALALLVLWSVGSAMLAGITVARLRVV